MVKSRNGLSHEYIIHPGETLKEMIEDRGMSQKELALRTGNSAKHISDVVNCLKPISVGFARKLEYALGVDASFWINLQSIYAQELVEYEELNHISDMEIKIVKKLKDMISHLIDLGFIQKAQSDQKAVIDLRKLLNISSLENIPEIASTGAYRKARTSSEDPYVMFSWIRLTELLTRDIVLDKEMDIELLEASIPKIKNVMFCEANEIQQKLTQIFSNCGIKFAIARNFKGAPVQGVITRENGTVCLIMTIRHKFADIFWFTLFHEIGHIINGDIKRRLIDYRYEDNITEYKADEYAKNIMINSEQYLELVEGADYSLERIKELADKNGVQPYIVLGRLQKEGLVEYSRYPKLKVRYEWA